MTEDNGFDLVRRQIYNVLHATKKQIYNAFEEQG